jgi:hypothetical protein
MSGDYAANADSVKEGKPVSQYAARPVARDKVEQTKAILITQPSITGPKLAPLLGCRPDTATRALRKAKEEISKYTDNLEKRAKKLQALKVEKAIESNEEQIGKRLTSLRLNAESLQDIADESGKPADIQAASRAWESLAKYERTVTGIEAEEKRSAASAGATNIALQVPLDPGNLGIAK